MKVISADVLAIPLYAHTIDIDFIVKGLTTVSQKMVDQWHNTHTCDNRYSILRKLKPKAKVATAAAWQIGQPTIKSINVARSRLRKKLNIDRAENLINYLNSL